VKKTLITCGEAGDPSGAVAAQQKLHAADPLNNGTDCHFAPFSALRPSIRLAYCGLDLLRFL